MSSPTSSQPKKAPKSILKKSKPSATPSAASHPAAAITPFPTEESTPEPTVDPSVREAVVKQARLIQQQHELEDQILDAIIELSKFPLSHSSSSTANTTTTTTTTTSHDTYDVTNPPAATISAFKTLIRPFQPGDYEDLIEERNTVGLCGYALCPRPRVKLGAGGAYKLVNYGRADFNIVPRNEIQRWCSPRCARRAMYVKVQLCETAAWERAGMDEFELELLDESKSSAKPAAIKGEDEEHGEAVKRVAQDLQTLGLDQKRNATRGAMDPALEQGDTKNSSRLITVTIRDKLVMKAAKEPSLDEDGEDHLVLDGYKTNFDPTKKSEAVNGGKDGKKTTE
ncbi:hypothetical protein GGR54DRAFT_110611 [Hypoxylon sp. NC1633]|nr:hypothetical protein GGR54DRAFT_110611 [Hypoxylon sp. NC1633]